MPAEIVCEIGLNHQKDLETAKRLIDAALQAGADSVKFQTFFGSFPHLSHLEFTEMQWEILFAYCSIAKIRWFSTAFDSRSIKFLSGHGMTTWKIPSGMITNYSYLGKIRMMQPKRTILSTGMSSYGEVETAIKILGTVNIVLQCTTAYPTPYEEVNLNAMVAMGKDILEDLPPWAFTIEYGLSDHTIGIEVPIAAVAMGAVMIEKHMTLDRDMTGPDHIASIEPDEFGKMVQSIRNVEKAMGDWMKQPTARELKNRAAIRKRMEGVE